MANVAEKIRTSWQILCKENTLFIIKWTGVDHLINVSVLKQCMNVPNYLAAKKKKETQQF